MAIYEIQKKMHKTPGKPVVFPIETYMVHENNVQMHVEKNPGSIGVVDMETTDTAVTKNQPCLLDFRQSSVIVNSLSSRVQGFSKSRAKEGLQRLRSLL